MLCGFLLVALTSPVIVKLLVLIAGLFMIYTGLHLLHVTQITHFVNDILRSLKRVGKE
jgi:threonine/homoserine/homoserine lactone efflux protein